MALSKEQISILRKQLHEQIKHLPEDKRKEAENQIENLSDEAIEEMLESQKSGHVEVFREIVSGSIKSKKIEENDSAIAVLEIKPISKGHAIIIPKEKITDVKKIPESITKFAEKIGKEIKEKLSPKEIKISPEIKLGEAIIDVIPLYEADAGVKKEPQTASEEQLDKVLKEIKEKKQEAAVEKKEEKKEAVKLKRRIP